MIIKSALLLSCLAATPVVLVSSTQDPGKPASPSAPAVAVPDTEEPIEAPTTAEPGEPGGGSNEAELRAQIQRLRDTIQSQREQIEDAEQRTQRLTGELREALDMLLSSPRGERNCTPSRDLITQHEWLHERGHREHAQKTIDRIARERRNDVGRLNRLAWNLMTDDDTAGQYDATAFALVERMQRSGRQLSHQSVDTCALAYFLNGRIEEAVQLQRAALARNKNDDYRRRLRTYEAALVAMQTRAKTAEMPPSASIASTEASTAEVSTTEFAAEATTTELAEAGGGDD